MLALKSHDIESYLKSKGILYRLRGQKAELQTCPFCHGGEHRDKWTCVVYLDVEGGNYTCMRGSCGERGSFWQLSQYFGDDPKQFYESDNLLRGNFKSPSNQVHPKPAFEPPEQPVKPIFSVETFQPQPLTPIALDYLHRRGFTDEVLNGASISCDETGNICFEYFHEGKTCFVKVRPPRKRKESEQKAWGKWKGGLRTLWGFEQCDPEYNTLVITFGEYDRLALFQSRVNNAVSVPSGDEDLEWITTHWFDLQRFTEIVLWPDNDVSGRRAMKKVADRLGEERVRVVQTKWKDANEMLLLRSREIGREAAEDEIYQAVIGAQWFHSGGLIRVIDIEDEEQDFTGYMTGFQFMNKAMHGFLIGQLTVHTGDSKHGKSSALTQLTATSIEQGGKVCAWSGEDDEQQYKYRMRVHLAGYEGTTFRTSKAGREYAVVIPAYDTAITQFLGSNLFLLNKRTGATEDNLLDSFLLAYKRFGCDVFIVDNLMKMVASKDTQQVYFRQAQIINKLSDFAKQYKVHCHIATHINKTGGSIEPPTKNTVSGAKEITNLADNVISWWRIPESVRSKYDGADAVCSILANRVFGDEVSQPLRYDWRIKRFGETPNDLMKSYFHRG